VDDVGNIAPLSVTSKDGFSTKTLLNPNASGLFGVVLAAATSMGTAGMTS